MEKEEEIIKIIEENLAGSKTLHDDKVAEIIKWQDIYDGKPYGNEVDGQSKMVWKLVKKQLESLIPNVAKPFVGSYDLIDLPPLTKNDVYKAGIYKRLANHFFAKGFNRDAFIKQLVRVMGKQGTGFVRVGWDRDVKEKKIKIDRYDENIQAIADETGAVINDLGDGKYELVKTTVKKNRPTAKVIRTESIFIDPTADSFDDAKFVIHEYKTSLSDLKKQKFLYDEDQLKKLEEIVDELEDKTYQSSEINEYNSSDFKFSDKSRKKITIYEYFGEYDLDGDGVDERVVCTLARASGNDSKRDVVLSLEENPFPFDRVPFVAIPLFDEEFSIYGKSLASLIEDEQKFMTSIVRSVIDNMANSNSGVKFFRKGALDAVNYNKLINGEKFIEVKTNEPINSVMMDGNFNELPQSVYNMFSLIDQHAESLTGFNKFMQGTVSTEISAAAANFSTVMNQSQIRLLDVVNNVSNGLQKIVYMWVEMCMAYLNDDEIQKITGINIDELKMKETNKLIQKFGIEELPEDVKQQAIMLIMTEVEDLFDKKDFKFDVEIKVGTDGSKDIKINQLNMFLQQAAGLAQIGAVPPDVIKTLIAELAELLDRPKIAEDIRSYEPQPDPMQQAMSEMELAQAQANAEKDKALAANAMARTDLTKAKAQEAMQSIDSVVANKYADVYKKMSEADKIEKESTRNTGGNDE